ncbi:MULTISPECIES: sensor domain-containing protein [unclassified Frankia]|uniref:sensor domain-containing protein n=1 Tax=unclassified Frankia TaxID=2632575 RepID=UPI0020248214
MTSPQNDPLRHGRHPIRLPLSSAPWIAAGYLGGYLLVGTVLFAVCLSLLSVAAATGIFWLGVPVLVGAAGIIRGCAQIERLRAGLAGWRIPNAYRPVLKPGILAQARTRWTDPATIRDCVYLILLYPLLFALDLTALLLWIAGVAGALLPLWYWSIPGEHGVQLGYFPDDGPGTGIKVDDLSTALLAAIGFAVLCVLLAYLVVAAARLHRAVATMLLRPPVDPLADARRMLTEPGPLSLAPLHLDR